MIENMPSQLFSCIRCKRELSRDAFYTRKDRRYEIDRWSWCIECHNKYTKDYYQKNKVKIARRYKRYSLALKYEAMNYYGRVCACCGESNFWFLEVDHINNNGAEHRREMGNKAWGGTNILQWLKANNWPEGFQFLCSNCNQAKSKYGICPHYKSKTSVDELSDSLGFRLETSN